MPVSQQGARKAGKKAVQRTSSPGAAGGTARRITPDLNDFREMAVHMAPTSMIDQIENAALAMQYQVQQWIGDNPNESGYALEKQINRVTKRQRALFAVRAAERLIASLPQGAAANTGDAEGAPCSTARAVVAGGSGNVAGRG